MPIHRICCSAANQYIRSISDFPHFLTPTTEGGRRGGRARRISQNVQIRSPHKSFSRHNKWYLVRYVSVVPLRPRHRIISTICRMYGNARTIPRHLRHSIFGQWKAIIGRGRRKKKKKNSCFDETVRSGSRQNVANSGVQGIRSRVLCSDQLQWTTISKERRTRILFHFCVVVATSGVFSNFSFGGFDVVFLTISRGVGFAWLPHTSIIQL